MSDADRAGAMPDTDQAGQPASPATSPDDYAEPGGDAPLVTPADSASRVGERESGDKDDIGSTDTMASPTGGLAGTSR